MYATTAYKQTVLPLHSLFFQCKHFVKFWIQEMQAIEGCSSEKTTINRIGNKN